MRLSQIRELIKGSLFQKMGLQKMDLNTPGSTVLDLLNGEASENGSDEKSEILDIGSLIVRTRCTITRPEILSTIIDYVEGVHKEKEEINIYHTTVQLSNGTQIPFNEYTKAFQDELHHQSKLFQPITKRYEIDGGSLLNKMTNASTKIKAVTFTGVLKKIDENSEIEFSLTDRVWFIMKSIFEEKIFKITENGLIAEDKR